MSAIFVTRQYEACALLDLRDYDCFLSRVTMKFERNRFKNIKMCCSAISILWCLARLFQIFRNFLETRMFMNVASAVVIIMEMIIMIQINKIQLIEMDPPWLLSNSFKTEIFIFFMENIL